MAPIIQQDNPNLQTDIPKIAIYLTNRCNLKCKHCFIEGNPQNNQFLNLNQVKTVLAHYQKEVKKVEFTGGESCLSPELLPSIKEAKKLGYIVGVNTNGINTKLPDLFTPNEVDYIIFSLDGSNSKTHDYLRGKGVFDRCIKTIKYAISKGFMTKAIFTVHKKNYTEVSDAIKLLDDLGVKQLSFNFISNQGTAILNQELLLPPEIWIQTRKKIENTTIKQISLRYPIIFATKEEFEHVKKNTSYFCRLLSPVKTEIYPDGKIYHCCLVPDIENLSAGIVTNTKVIMDTSKEVAFVNKYRHLSCPVHEIRKLYASSSNLIPLCLYYKYITPNLSS